MQAGKRFDWAEDLTEQLIMALNPKGELLNLLAELSVVPLRSPEVNKKRA